MKIAQIAPIGERVPPQKYGGTERVIYELTEQLVKRGHDVTLFASGNSKTSAKLSAIIPKSLRELDLKNPYGLNEWTFLHFGIAYALEHEFDIIHDHNYAISMPTAHLAKTPVLNTVHGAFNESNIPLYSMFDNVYLNTISRAQAPQNANLNIVGNVYHGLSMRHYPFGEKPGTYALFVGRIAYEKGVHLAIQAAKKARVPLILAAKLDSDKEHQYYFNTYIKPELKSGVVEWVGEVNETERNKLMSEALCLLHAVTWPEPFGLTLIESMACGLPVIAMNKGSIPEIVRDGETGFVVNTVTEMVHAIKKIKRIDRKRCREYALLHFTPEKMADDYEAIYERIVIHRDQKEVKQKRSEKLYKSLNKLLSPVFPNFPDFIVNSQPFNLGKLK